MKVFDIERPGKGRSFLYVKWGMWFGPDVKWIVGIRHGWLGIRGNAQPARIQVAVPCIWMEVPLSWIPIYDYGVDNWDYSVNWAGGFVWLSLGRRCWYLRMPYARSRDCDPRKPLPDSAILSPSRAKEIP